MGTILHKGKPHSLDEIRARVLQHYEDVFRSKRDKRVHMLALLSDCGRDTRVLDYGCGYGTVSRWLVERFGCQVDAVDASPEELEKGKTAYGAIREIHFMSLEEFDFPAERYDLVISSHVIEHVHNVGSYLSRINAMLKTDGHLLISLPNIVNLRFLTLAGLYSERRAIARSRAILEEYSKPDHHINGWDPHHFLALNASCGFQVERFRPTGHISLPLFNLRWRIPILRKWSSSMAFLFRKVKNVTIAPTD